MDSKNLSCEEHFFSLEGVVKQMKELNANSTDKVCIDQKKSCCRFFFMIKKIILENDCKKSKAMKSNISHLSKVQEYTQGNIHSQFCS